MQVFLYINEQQVGPYTAEQLHQLVAENQITLETPAWYEGLSDWTTVAAILEAFPVAELQLSTMPPPPEAPDVNCRNRRTFAGVIDMCILPLAILPLLLIIELGFPRFFGDNHSLPMFGWILSGLTVACFLSSRCQATPGMMLLGVIAMSDKGMRIDFFRALARHIVSIFSLFFLLGYLLWNFNKKRQTLHDMAVGSIVIRKPKDFSAGKSAWLLPCAIFIPSLVLTLLMFAVTSIGTTVSNQAKTSSSTMSESHSVVSTPSPLTSSPPDPTNATPVSPPSDATAPVATTDPDNQTSDNSTINQVKDSTLDFDSTVKIGPALEGSSFLKDVTWKIFRTAQGRIVVEVTGMVNMEAYKNTDLDENGTKLPAEWVDTALKNLPSLQFIYTAQFELSQRDNSIAVGYSGYTMKGKNLQTGQPVKTEIKDEDDYKILKSFFDNRPDLHVSGILVGLSQQQGANPTPSAPQ